MIEIVVKVDDKDSYHFLCQSGWQMLGPASYGDEMLWQRKSDCLMLPASKAIARTLSDYFVETSR